MNIQYLRSLVREFTALPGETEWLDFKIHEFTFDENPIVLFEIPCASHRPVSFKAIEYIRIGTYKKPLKDFPEKERLLWNLFENLSKKLTKYIPFWA